MGVAHSNYLGKCDVGGFLIFEWTLADSLKIYFILLFSFSKCPLLLIKVDFDWDFVLNKYSLRAYLPKILNDNVN
jgi:hypothetical protein